MNNGGVWTGDGYRRILIPGHPRANIRGYVSEHILIAERVLGRPLPAAVVVHHNDRDGMNNANENLVICPDQAYHLLIHARLRALEACGNAGWKRCIHCGKYDDPAMMGSRQCAARPSPNHYHPECNNRYAREYRRRPLRPEAGL